MSGKNPRMNPLESRKQLLIAESELNRAQLVQELETDEGRSSLARKPGANHQFTRVRRRDIGRRTCVLPAQKGIRARRRKTFVVADHCQGRRTGFNNLVGVPLNGSRAEGKIKGCEADW